MNFDCRLKGYITEAIIESLLIDAGHVVIRTGIERVLLEPAAKQGAEEWLEAPLQLRKAPDFFVIEKGDKQASRYVEIKYRKNWIDGFSELEDSLHDQVKFFNEVFVIVCAGEEQNGNVHRRKEGQRNSVPNCHIRVAHAVLNSEGVVCHKGKDKNKKEILRPIDRCCWSDLEHLQNVFPKLDKRKEEETLVKAATLIANINASIEAAKTWKRPEKPSA